MIRYVDHVAITVKDLAQSIAFYAKLGFAVIRQSESPTQTMVFVGNGLAELELFGLKDGAAKDVPPLQGDEVGIKHIAFHVDDLEGVVKALKTQGVAFTTDIRRSGSRASIFFKDPDGTILQLLQG
jgi:catechol 2,3-dioxygenase-like lactoylglutathione lyase family enzyme